MSGSIVQTFSDKPFIGSGWDYPFSIAVSYGGIKVDAPSTHKATFEKIADGLNQLLFVQKGTRFMRRDWGTVIPSLAFEPNDAGLTEVLINTLKTDIQRAEKRIRIVEAGIDDSLHPKNGRLSLIVRAQLVNTNVVGNMVFPFYTLDNTNG